MLIAIAVLNNERFCGQKVNMRALVAVTYF